MKRSITLATLTTMALILNACGGGSSTKTTTIQGKLIDSPVYGAQYKCGKMHDKVTQQDGTFVCEALPVTFYVGGVRLGEVHKVPADGYVTPHDLAGVARGTYGEKVNNIALFLQSLDDDGNIETAIQIRQGARDRLKNRQYDIHAMTHDQVVDLLGEVNVVNIVSREEAHEHLRRHVEAIPVTHEPVKPNPTAPTPTKPTPVKPTPTKPTSTTPTKPTPTKPTPTKPNPTTHTPIKPNPTKHRP